jgi:hypothetical protein
LGWQAGIYLRGRIPLEPSGLNLVFNTVLSIVFGLGILFTANTIKLTAELLPLYQERAAIWDERDITIREAASNGIEIVEVKGIDGRPVGGLHDLKTDGNHWVNHCAALYYGVKEIRASLNP